MRLEFRGVGGRGCGGRMGAGGGGGLAGGDRWQEGGGVELLAVFRPAEAEQLAAAGIVTPILILMPVTDIGRTDILYRCAVAGRLHLAIHSLAQLQHVETLGRKSGTCFPAHV